MDCSSSCIYAICISWLGWSWYWYYLALNCKNTLKEYIILKYLGLAVYWILNQIFGDWQLFFIQESVRIQEQYYEDLGRKFGWDWQIECQFWILNSLGRLKALDWNFSRLTVPHWDIPSTKNTKKMWNILSNFKDFLPSFQFFPIKHSNQA